MMTTPMSRLLLCALMICACTCSLAEEPAPAPASASGSANVQAKDLLNKPVVPLKIEAGTTLAEAVNKLIASAGGLTWMVGGKAYHTLDPVITQEAQLLPLPEMELKAMTVLAALGKITAAADAQYSINYQGQGSYTQVKVSRKRSTDMKRLVYFVSAGQRLDDVVAELLRSTNLNYVVSPDIGGLVINATFKGVPLDATLSAVLRAVGADYKIDNNIVYVMPTPTQSAALAQLQMNQVAAAAAPSAAPGPAADSRPESVVAPMQKVVSQAVTLRNVRAGDVAPIITKPGVNVLSTNANNAVITGPEDQVKQAASLIEALDKDDALPRPVRINVSAKATWNTANKKPVVALMNPSISTAEGRDGSFEITSDVKDSAGVPGMAVRFSVHAQPTVTSDGRISVSGSFAFEWVIKAGNVNQVLFSSPDVPVAASLEPGKSQNVASIKMGTSKDGEAVLEVTFTATIEKGRVSPAANNSGGFGGGYGGNNGPGGRSW